MVIERQVASDEECEPLAPNRGKTRATRRMSSIMNMVSCLLLSNAELGQDLDTYNTGCKAQAKSLFC
jgi:hypothetical protein